MSEVETGATLISSYGLYTIISALCVVIVYLYKRIADLERDMRTTMANHMNENTKLLVLASDAIKTSSETLDKFQETLSELRMSISIAIEKMDFASHATQHAATVSSISGAFRQPSFSSKPNVIPSKKGI